MVIVKVAMATGRRVIEVAREPFAITFWIFWHVQQLHELDIVEQKLARIDAASLMTFSFNEPKKLEQIQKDYLASVTVRPGANGLDIETMTRHIENHKYLVQIEPGE